MLVLASFILTFATIDFGLEAHKYVTTPKEKVVGQTFKNYYDWPRVPKITNPKVKATAFKDPERPLVSMFLQVENRCVPAGEFRKVMEQLGFKRLGAGLDVVDLQDEVNTNNLSITEIWFNLHKQFIVANTFVMEDSGIDYTCIVHEAEDFMLDNLNALLQHPFYNKERGI
jgi:hypothetical protein